MTNAGMEGRGYAYLLACRANKTSGADIAQGDALQWDRTGTEGPDVKQPATTGLLSDFAGIAVGDVMDGDIKAAALAVHGPVRCKFLNNASAAKGTYATPVNGQDYLTYSAKPTNIILLTDQSSGTAVHGPDEGDDAPVVFLLPHTAKGQMKVATAYLPNVSNETNGSTWVDLGEPAKIIGGSIVNLAAKTGAAVVTFKIGGTEVTGLSLTVANGAAIGTCVQDFTVTGANTVAAGTAVEIATDGGGSDTVPCMVSVFYVPN